MKSQTKRQKIPKHGMLMTVSEDDPSFKTSALDYSYEVSRSYRNCLSYPIILMDRFNLAVKIPSIKPKRGEPSELTINVVIRYNQDVVFDYTHMLDTIDESSPMELQIIKRALNNQRIHVEYGRDYISFNYKVSDATLRGYNYMLYADQLDMVICKPENSDRVVHPRSEEGIYLKNSLDLEGFSYGIVINDPYNQFGERYINVVGDVFRIKPVADKSQQPGVYRYANGMNYYSFETADKDLQLFTTEALAKQLGQPDEHIRASMEQQSLQYRKEIMEKEHEITKLRNDYEAEQLARKQEHDGISHSLKEREAELKRLELEYKRLTAIESQRLQEIKTDLEIKSLNRKDSSEFMKWLPALLAGAGALFTLLI